MKQFVMRRLGYSLLSLLVLSLTIFLFVRVLPMISIFEMRTILPGAKVDEDLGTT